MKKIYFGEVSAEDDTSDTFHFNNKNYYYCLEFDNEIFTIKDTCNRNLPFDIECLTELNKVLLYLNNYTTAQKIAKEWTERSIARLGKVYGFDTQAL